MPDQSALQPGELLLEFFGFLRRVTTKQTGQKTKRHDGPHLFL